MAHAFHRDDATFAVISGSDVPREVLTAARTYYVRADGSDSNDGLTNSAGGAFLTLQKAIDTIGMLDLSIYAVTVQIGLAGTYAGCTVAAPFVGGPGSSVTIIGNVASASSFIISSQIFCTNNGIINVAGVKYVNGSGSGLVASLGAIINVSGVSEFGACSGVHMLAVSNGSIIVGANYTINGNTSIHLFADATGYIVAAGLTVTLTGTPAWGTAFAVAQNGYVQANGNTYSGAATGTRYSATLNGVVTTLGGGATALPGNVGGSTATGGQYT